MKFFTNKSIWSKIVIVLIFVLVFQFIVCKPSLGSGADVIEFGGKLISPIVSLFVTLGDAAMGLIHSSIMGADDVLIQVDLGSPWWEILGKIIFWVLAAAVTVAVAFIPGVNILAAATAGIVVGVIGTTIWANVGDVTGATKVKTASYAEANLPVTLYLPAYTVSPEEIFQGKVLLFNVDFFNESKEIKAATKPRVNKDGKYLDEGNNILEEEYQKPKFAYQDIDFYYYEDPNGKELDVDGMGTTAIGVKTSKQNMAQELRGIISKWYVALRNIALVAMMIVLIYIGIRILMSTLASDKAKYKQMLQDWFIGLLLLFFMHYIMAFSVTIVQKVTDMVSASVDSKTFSSIIPNDENGKLSEFVKTAGMGEYWLNAEGKEDPEVTDEGGYLCYPSNLIAWARIRAELANWGTEYIGYAIVFLVLVMFTVFFIFTYLKRVLYMAFLTIIAPLVALTYPIDKINDGSAQGFDKWLKEYIFNLLVQPLHLLLYYILITSAFQLAADNMIYSLVAIGFMMPAEKLLRSFFGFEKAHTPGMLAGPAGAALAMSAVSKIANFGRGSKKQLGSASGGSSSGGKGDDGDDFTPPRFSDKAGGLPDVTDLFGKDDNKAQNKAQDKSKKTLQIASAETGESSSGSVSQRQIGSDKASSNPQQATSGNKLGRRFKRKAGATIAAGRAYAKRSAINAAKSLPKRTIRFAGGVAGRTVGAVGLGAVGMAAGIATGDMSKAFQYTVAGSVAGSSISGNAINNLSNTLSNVKSGLSTGEAGEAYKRKYNRAEFDDIAQEEYMREFKKKNEAVLRANEFSKQEIAELYKDGGNLETYMANGVTDIKDIVKAEQMIKNSEFEDISEAKSAITLLKTSKMVGDGTKGLQRRDWEKLYIKDYISKKNLSREEAKEKANKTLDYIDKCNKLDKKFRKY